jgi:hypothetical protein
MVSDLQALEKRLEETLETTLEAKLEAKLETKLETKLDQKLDAKLDARFKAHEEELRRHFNVVAERIEGYVKLVAEVNAHHTVILDDHEARLKRLEKRR